MESNLNFATDIPEELREMVLNKLPQEEVLTLRSVCTQLKHEVDFLYDFEFKNYIPVTNVTLKTFPKIRVRKYIINRLSSIPLYSNTVTALFAFPHQLRSLRIKSKRIRSTDYQSLLEECCESLKEFSLDIGNQTIYFTGLLKPRITFKNLVKLQIRDHRSPFVAKDVVNLTVENDIYLNIVENIPPSCPLNSLVVKLQQNEEEPNSAFRYIQALFVLIAQHQNSLQYVQHKYSNSHWQISPSIRRNYIFSEYTFNDVGFSNVKNLLLVNLDFSRAVLPLHWNSSWKFLILQQYKLRNLSLRSMEGLLEAGFLYRVISQNSKTLREIVIQFPDNGEKGNLNMEVFQSCTNLKNVIFLGPYISEWRLKNFILPNSIQVLQLIKFKVGMAEMMDFFRSSTQIREITLVLQSSNDSEGLMGSVIYLILGQASLLKFYLCYSSTFQINEEDVALAEILEKYYPSRAPSRYLILRLSRVQPSQDFQAT